MRRFVDFSQKSTGGSRDACRCVQPLDFGFVTFFVPRQPSQDYNLPTRQMKYPNPGKTNAVKVNRDPESWPCQTCSWRAGQHHDIYHFSGHRFGYFRQKFSVFLLVPFAFLALITNLYVFAYPVPCTWSNT